MSENDREDELQRARARVAELEELLAIHQRSTDEESQRYEAARREAEQRADALRESEKRFKKMIDHAPEAIVLLDVDAGSFADANPNALELFQLSRDELLQRHPVELSPTLQPDGQTSAESGRTQIEAALQGQTRVFEWVHRNASGELIPCEVRLLRLPWGDRNLVRASITDISARKKAELDLTRARDTAEAASRAKSDFLANMSHEMRTPLNAILGMTTLVLDTELNESQREFLEMVKESGESLLSIIADMLDFSKIEAGKLELIDVDFQLRDRLHRALRPLLVRADDKQLKSQLIIDEDVPDCLRGDFDRLRQILLNLVGNAIKFTDRGEIQIHVKQDSQVGELTTLQFGVKDTGVGIAHEHLASIFEAFEQADSSLTRRHGGTGLGLSISSRLAKLLGGRIWAESELGKGSTFQFTVTFQRRQEQVETVPSKKPIDPAPGVSMNLRILLAEDSKTNQVLAVSLLSKWKHEVTVADDGVEALKFFDQQPFDLVLMDVQMPNMDGLKTTSEIRRREKFSRRYTPVIAMTAHAMGEDRDKCLAAGMDGFVTKPVNADGLRKEMESVLTATRHRGHDAS